MAKVYKIDRSGKSLPENWQLETEDIETQLTENVLPRYKSVKKSESSVVSVRIPDAILRVMDEYVWDRTKKGTNIKTRSDAVIEACLQWVWNLRHENIKIDPVLLFAYETYVMINERASLQNSFEQSQKLFQDLKYDKDVEGIKKLLKFAENTLVSIRGARRKEWESFIATLKECIRKQVTE